MVRMACLNRVSAVDLLHQDRPGELVGERHARQGQEQACLVAQRGMAEEDARARMAHQATRDDRVAKADYVLDNSGSLDALHAAVDALWPALVALGDEPR